MQELFEKFTAILTETFGVPAEEISPEATFESLSLDSLDLVELTLVVEEQTGAKIEDDELESIRTVGDAVAAVAAKTGAAA